MYLNCHTRFSFHYGTLSVEQLLEEARRHGVRKLVLTDINNTSGVLDFIRLAPKYGVEAAVGVEFRQGDTVRFIGIARNNEGFEELNRYLSDCLLAGAHEGKSSGNRDAIVPDTIPHFHNVAVIVPAFVSPDNCRHPLSIDRDRPSTSLLLPIAIGIRSAQAGTDSFQLSTRQPKTEPWIRGFATIQDSTDNR